MAALGGNLTGYYRLHARVYDLTRWAFLFGRNAMVKQIVARKPGSVLEIGCGTGRNLAQLATALPDARLHGVDLSPDMLEIARQKCAQHGNVQLHLGEAPKLPAGGCEVVLMSYLLSMTGAQAQALLQYANSQLAPNGVLAVVDFENSPSAWFRRWMGYNHVHLDGSLSTLLREQSGLQVRSKRAYFGLWSWLSACGPEPT